MERTGGKQRQSVVIETLAIGLFSEALAERCQETMVRLTTPDTIVAEIEDFQRKALQHLESSMLEGLLENKKPTSCAPLEHTLNGCAPTGSARIYKTSCSRP